MEKLAAILKWLAWPSIIFVLGAVIGGFINFRQVCQAFEKPMPEKVYCQIKKNVDPLKEFKISHENSIFK